MAIATQSPIFEDRFDSLVSGEVSDKGWERLMALSSKYIICPVSSEEEQLFYTEKVDVSKSSLGTRTIGA